jgi:hypothetical protein
MPGCRRRLSSVYTSKTTLFGIQFGYLPTRLESLDRWQLQVSGPTIAVCSARNPRRAVDTVEVVDLLLENSVNVRSRIQSLPPSAVTVNRTEPNRNRGFDHAIYDGYFSLKIANIMHEFAQL